MGSGGEGEIYKGLRDIFGVWEVFQYRAVVMALQLSKVTPRAPGQPVRASFSGRRADHRKTELALGPGLRRSDRDPSVGKSLGLSEPPLRLAGATGPRRGQRSCPQSLASGSHHRLSPVSKATCLSFHLYFFRRSATLRYKALTFTATWMHPENTMLNGRNQTQKDTHGVIPLTGNVQNR